MQGKPSTTDRFFADCVGPDDKALAAAFRWLLCEIERRQTSGCVVTCAKGNARSLSRVLGKDKASALIAGRSLSVHNQTVSLATMTRDLPPLQNLVVLAVWLIDDHLSKLDDGLLGAICVVPWNQEHIRRWLASWRPVEIDTGTPRAALRTTLPAKRLDDVVAAAGQADDQDVAMAVSWTCSEGR